jgi:ATPase complex subunit ATP10
MLQSRITSPFRSALYNTSNICLRCQWQALRPQRIARFPTRQFSSSPFFRLPTNDTKPSSKPEPKAKDDEELEFVPKPLGRPIGFKKPPQPGENVTIPRKKTYTGRTMSERNLEKRKDIVEQWGQNYFRDFKNIRKYRSGKTFIANSRIFKKDLSLYFPNFRGSTLKESNVDTTDVLKGKVSVVRVYSSQWGEGQVMTFTGKKENPELGEILDNNKDVAQIVDLNIDENWLKAIIVRLFQGRLRSQRSEEDWGKYFMIQKLVSNEIRETIGLMNGRVGYVYLLDEQCRIRWAGSGNAEGTEVGDLNKGLNKLIQDSRDMKAARLEARSQRAEKSEVEEELEAQAVSAGAS